MYHRKQKPVKSYSWLKIFLGTQLVLVLLAPVVLAVSSRFEQVKSVFGGQEVASVVEEISDHEQNEVDTETQSPSETSETSEPSAVSHNNAENSAVVTAQQSADKLYQVVTPISSRSNPFAGRNLFVSNHDPAGQTATEWAESDPESSTMLLKISGKPIGVWLTRGFSDIGSYVGSIMTQASANGRLPVLVVYGMPSVSCGSASADASYLAWVDSIKNAIAGRRVVIIMEPDELALTNCSNQTFESQRIDLLRQAVLKLKVNDLTSIYIDAGHGKWVSSSVMADRLIQAGVQAVQGFSLNVSNYHTNTTNTSYGNSLSSKVGGAHFVIDTSRNGLGPTEDYEWCNAPGRALGEPPQAVGFGALDAYLWIKYPGESDLSCNGGPAEGQWWPEYAVGLASRASW